MIVLATQLHAQTFNVLHSFGSRGDGYEPLSGVTLDAHGNLYGVTYFGGNGSGMAYKLAPQGPAWVYSKLHVFNGSDGSFPQAKLRIGRDGSLYGTAANGGGDQYYGAVFNLRPSPTVCRATECLWQATVLHSFDGYDESFPPASTSTARGTSTARPFKAGQPVREWFTKWRFPMAPGLFPYSPIFQVRDYPSRMAG